MATTLCCATRQSPLARWQSEYVVSQLQATAAVSVHFESVVTDGDRWLDTPLSDLGGKGLFIKALEEKLLDKTADFAVHSLKDMPFELHEAFTLAAYLPRHQPADAFVSEQYASFDALPEGAVVGTCSLRRAAQIKARRPDLIIHPLRGNIHTRLKKLQAGDYHAIILAAAGLERMGLSQHIQQQWSPTDVLPAPGQGVIVVQTLAENQALIQQLQALNDEETQALVGAERRVSQLLGGSCHTPLGAYAYRDGDKAFLTASVWSKDGSVVLTSHQEGTFSEVFSLGEQAADALLSQGAAALLQTDC